MVYIAPVPRSNQQKHQPAPAVGGGKAAGKGHQHEAHQQQLQLPLPDSTAYQAAGKNQQRKAQQQPAAKPKARPDVVRSKQDLLQELNRQAEWNTQVLQREQAALRALQESQMCGLPAHASANAHPGSTGLGASQDIMGPPAGLRPLAVKAAKNHRFYDVSPKAFNPAQVPGLSATTKAAAAQGSSTAGQGWPAGLQQQQQQQHQQHQAAFENAARSASPAAGRMSPAHARQQQQQQQQQQQPRGARVPGPVASRAAAGAAAANSRQPAPQQGRNTAQRPRQRVNASRQPAAAAKAQAASKLNAAKGAMAAAAAAVAAAEAEVDDASQAADDNEGQLSPFSAADWRFEWNGPGSPNAAYAAAPQQFLMNQTFPDSPQFRTGRVFEIPADGGLGMSAAHGAMHVAGMVGQQQPVHHGGPMHYAAAHAHGYGSPTGAENQMPQGLMPLAQLQFLQQQQQQQQQQYAQEVAWLGMQHGEEGNVGSSAYTEQFMQQQMQPQQLLQSCRTLADVADAMQAVQSYADPAVRTQLVKELKQKQYKLELEQQIADREAARQATKVATVAREAAENAARAAAPPPWDPAAKAGRWGGGGEPFRSIDGAAVADLRAMKSRLPVPGLETSQTFGSLQQPQQFSLPAAPNFGQPQQQQQQQQFGLAGSPPAAASAPAAAAAASAAAAGMPVMAGSAETVAADAAAAAAAAAAAGKGFMSGLHQLKAGPSDQQRIAAAAARQQLLDDLQAQVAEKAARAAAEAAAEAARTAVEEAAIQRYYTGQQHQKEQQHSPTQPSSEVQPMQPPNWGTAAGLTGANSSFGLGSGGQAMLQASAAEASGRAVHAGAAAGGGSSNVRNPAAGPVAVRKGRSKNVIEAPWLDQLQQPAQQNTQQQQQQQQQQQKLLSAQASSYTVAAQPEPQQQQQLGTSSSTMYAAAPALQQSIAAAVGEQLSSRQLGAALQELQQEQQLMWQEFTRQARALKHLLSDKQLSPSDSQQAWDELQRMRGVMGQAQEQQQALQQIHTQQQHQQPAYQQHSPRQRTQPQAPQVKGRGRHGAQQQQQQQQQQPQQEMSWMSQQHSTLCVSSQPVDVEQQQQLGSCEELPGNSLHAFMVETQMVPLTVNSIPDSIDVGSSLMQLMIPPTVLAAGSSRLGQPVQHYNRYGGYGLDAELSSCSMASASLQAKHGHVSSSSAHWGGLQGNQQQQQAASRRPPASPPILRGDRFVEGRPEKQPAGSSTAKTASQQQQASPPRRAGTGNAAAGRAAARGGKASGGGAAGSAGKASNVRRRV